MALTAGTPTRVTNNFNVFEIFGPITLSGNASGTGDTLSLAGLVPSNSVPDWVEIIEIPTAGTAASGCSFNYASGTTQANGAVQTFKGGTAQTGTYASLGVTNLYYLAQFVKFQ